MDVISFPYKTISLQLRSLTHLVLAFTTTLGENCYTGQFGAMYASYDRLVALLRAASDPVTLVLTMRLLCTLRYRFELLTWTFDHVQTCSLPPDLCSMQTKRTRCADLGGALRGTCLQYHQRLAFIHDPREHALLVVSFAPADI